MIETYFLCVPVVPCTAVRHSHCNEQLTYLFSPRLGVFREEKNCFYLLNNGMRGKDHRIVAYHPSPTEDCLASIVYIEPWVSFPDLSHRFSVPHSLPFSPLSIHEKTSSFIQFFHRFTLLVFTFWGPSAFTVVGKEYHSITLIFYSWLLRSTFGCIVQMSCT